MRLTPSIVLLRTQSDQRLTTLARKGSEAAFTALVERYRRTVLRACCRVLSEARAEDATQQTFLAAWKALERGDDVREVRPWLLKIARNTALNALRTPGYEYVELAESLQGGAAPQAELERRDVMRQTLAGLAALPENQREALLRSAVEGAPHADIARDLGISEGATRQLVLRARAALRATATALTPLPLISSLATGGGAVGSAFAAKAAAVVVLGGTAVATPVVIDRGGDGPGKARAAEPVERPAPVVRAAKVRAAGVPTVAPVAATAMPTARRAGPSSSGRRPARVAPPAVAQADDGREDSSADDRQDERDDLQEDARDDLEDRQDDALDDREDREDDARDDLEDHEDDADDDSSGPGGGAPPVTTSGPAPAPAATVEDDDGNSGSGSGNSGSGSSSDDEETDDDED